MIAMILYSPLVNTYSDESCRCCEAVASIIHSCISDSNLFTNLLALLDQSFLVSTLRILTPLQL